MQLDAKHDFDTHPAVCLECCFAISGLLERRGGKRWRIGERLLELTSDLMQVVGSCALACVVFIDCVLFRSHSNHRAPNSVPQHLLGERWFKLGAQFHPLDREANHRNIRRIELLRSDIAGGVGNRDTKIRQLESEMAINAQHMRSLHGHWYESDVETHECE